MSDLFQGRNPLGLLKIEFSVQAMDFGICLERRNPEAHDPNSADERKRQEALSQAATA
jgi:hypothetical protein